MAQSEPHSLRTRVLYLATFALILLYREWPWATWLAERAALE